MPQNVFHSTNLRTLKNGQYMHVKVKRVFAWDRLCLSMFECVCVCAVLQWAACGGTEGLCMVGSVGGLRDSPWKTITSQGHFPSRGSEMCECVRENACGSFYILFVKVHSIQSQTIVLLTIIPLYNLSNALGGCQLKWAQWCIVLWLVVPCAGINLLSAPRTQQCLKVIFGLDLEPKLMF